MMKTFRNLALPGLLALALLAACSGKQQPAAGAAVDDEEETASAPATPAPQPPRNFAGQAAGMMSLLSDAPECQSYRDELQAIADAPEGTQPAREPSQVVAAAHDARCSKKARGE